MTRVTWSREARDDIARITDYYSAAAPDFTIRLFDRLDAAIALLRDRPLGGVRVEGHDLRKLRVGRTPYILFYRVRPSSIEIARVVHAARDWRAVL